MSKLQNCVIAYTLYVIFVLYIKNICCCIMLLYLILWCKNINESSFLLICICITYELHEVILIIRILINI